MRSNKILIALLILALFFRLIKLDSAPNFTDIDWFKKSANQAIQQGSTPLLGITSSITWLHQGAFWTYMLIPAQFMNISPLLLTIGMGLASISVIFISLGLVPAVLVTMLPFFVLQDLTVYHTTPILLLFFLSYLLLVRGRGLLAGLFIGFLYQSHLLTFIYWPLFSYMAYKNKIGTWVLVGFGVSIIPFIVSGPVQTLGIFVWGLKQVLAGFSGVSSGVSTAYWVVISPLLILTLGKVVKWIYAYSGSSGKK